MRKPVFRICENKDADQLRDKGGITPEEDHEDRTTSWKIEGRSESVVKMKPFSGLQDHSTF